MQQESKWCIAGAERLVGECKFHFLGKCTMVLTNMYLDFMHIASSGLCISCMNAHLWVYNMTSLDNTKPYTTAVVP